MPGPSTFEKGMILLTGAVSIGLYPTVQRVAAVLSAHAEHGHVVKGLLFGAQLLDFALLDEVARYAHHIVILKIPGEVAQAARKGALDDGEDRVRGLEPGLFKLEAPRRWGCGCRGSRPCRRCRCLPGHAGGNGGHRHRSREPRGLLPARRWRP